MLAFERMTIFCASLEASLGFYRDAVGLVVVEEKTLEGAAAGTLLQLPPCRMRIALLAPAADAQALLGLFEISGVALGRIDPPRGDLRSGQTALVLRTDSFDSVASRLISQGVCVLTPPLSYPKTVASARSPAGLYREMIVYDPDGVLVSILQIDPLPAPDGA